MINSGKIKVDNKEYNVFLEQVGETITPVETIPIPQPITGNNYYLVTEIGAGVQVAWNIAGGSGNYSYRLGTAVYIGSMNAPKNVNWDVTVIDNGTRKEYPVKVDTSKRGAVNFNGTGNDYIIEENTSVVNSTTPPVVVQSNNNSFNFNQVQLNIAPLNQKIKLSKKIHFQTSAWSAGRNYYGNSGMRFQLSRDGRTIYNLELKDDEFPKEVNNSFNLSSHPDDLKNNHPTCARLILPEGDYKVEYENSSSSIDYPIVFTLIDAKNAGYFVYYPCGLTKEDTLFFKQLDKGESLTTNLRLHDTVGVIRQEGDTLCRGVFINFIVDGKISLERFQTDFGGGQYQTFDYFRSVSAIDNSIVRYVMEKDHSKFIEIEFFPNSNEFKVLAKNGIDVAEEHIDLTQSVFNKVDYTSNGVKFPNFKMTNNAGFEMMNEFGSIMQKNINGDLVENGAEHIIIPFINGKYQSTQKWRYNCIIQ